MYYYKEMEKIAEKRQDSWMSPKKKIIAGAIGAAALTAAGVKGYRYLKPYLKEGFGPGKLKIIKGSRIKEVSKPTKSTVKKTLTPAKTGESRHAERLKFYESLKDTKNLDKFMADKSKKLIL